MRAHLEDYPYGATGWHIVPAFRGTLPSSGEGGSDMIEACLRFGIPPLQTLRESDVVDPSLGPPWPGQRALWPPLHV